MPPSLRQLIAELAQIEDAIGWCSASAAPRHPLGPINPELLALAVRENELLRTLRGPRPLKGPGAA